MSTRPILTLTTDFGLRDPFVGILKGVIAGICPAAHVIDVTHEIPAFDLLEGALAIQQAWRYFPAGTVHVVVVDPGVGSQRRPVLCRIGSAWFVAPDNGVLTLVEREASRQGEDVTPWLIENPRFMLQSPSSTFHGRDIFAPAAAHLAAQLEQGNAKPEIFGQRLASLVQLSMPEPVHHANDSIEGAILKADRFGNLLTNLAEADLPAAASGFAIQINGLRITRLCRYFAEASEGEMFAIMGSSGLLEIAVNRGSAQQRTGAVAGTKLQLKPR